MLLLSSRMLFSQNTKPTELKCYNAAQVNEFYKCAQLNSQRKKQIEVADRLILEQKNEIKTVRQLVDEKNKLIENMQAVQNSDLTLKNAEISGLHDYIRAQEKAAKKQSRRKFWNGFAVGGLTIGVAGVIILLTQ